MYIFVYFVCYLCIYIFSLLYLFFYFFKIIIFIFFIFLVLLIYFPIYLFFLLFISLFVYFYFPIYLFFHSFLLLFLDIWLKQTKSSSKEDHVFEHSMFVSGFGLSKIRSSIQRRMKACHHTHAQNQATLHKPHHEATFPCSCP